jgi:TPR repeat protein
MVSISLWATALLILVAGLVLRNKPLEVTVALQRHHWVQLLMHGTIFIYWASVVPAVKDQLYLILAQLLVGYLLDLLLSWWKLGRWTLGLAPVPVIGSINLFLWFKDDWWFLQIVMVVLAFASKPLLRWTRNGRNTHIFNPSAIALAALSLGVILADSTDITWGQTIATSLNAPGYMLETIFFVGVVVQILFDTTLVTAGAALTTWLVSVLWYHATGEWFFHDTHIPIAVFLGMNLLITDPSTSPVNKTGRFLYGATYGACVFFLWSSLDFFRQPTFYDKLLQVPILNLLVPVFDKVGRGVSSRMPNWSWAGSNWVHVVLWTIAFFAMRPELKLEHPNYFFYKGQQFLRGVDGHPAQLKQAIDGFHTACEQGDLRGCFEMAMLIAVPDAPPGHLKAGIERYQRVCAPAACDTKSPAYKPSMCMNYAARACYRLGVHHASGVGVSRDLSQAKKVWQRACQMGEEDACKALTSDEKTEPDTAALTIACEKDEAAACERLSNQYALGGNGLKRDLVRAANFGLRACMGGRGEACKNVGQAYFHGAGVNRDLSKALDLFGRGCSANHLDACVSLAGMYLNGLGVPVDVAKARKLLQRGCTGGVKRACEFIK